MANRRFVGIEEKRSLTSEEDRLIKEQEVAWIPRWFPDYGTPMYRLVSSPSKGFALGASAGFVAGTAASALVGARRRPLPVHFALGVLGGLAWGGGVFINRTVTNGNLVEIMRRLPAPVGADHLTLRDYRTDPVVQKDREIGATQEVAAAIRSQSSAPSSPSA